MSSANNLNTSPSAVAVNNQLTVTLPQRRSPVVCIVGVGYVGESLLRHFGDHYSTVGFDISPKRIADLQQIYSHNDNITLTNEESLLATATHYLISVPTLLKEDQSVDMTHLKSAIRLVSNYARPGCTIVIESSVSVGTTRSLLQQYQETGIYCGMSPERVDPGRVVPAATEIPKIISGLTPSALQEIETLYSKVFQRVVPVSRPEVAEMTKLYENCYRMVNIAYTNEMSDACLRHGIDPNEMISAAATKPFGFQEFRPGLGVGGHCIPVNPFYLFANNPQLPVLQTSTKMMLSRPKRLAKKFYKSLAAQRMKNRKLGKPLASRPRVLVIGVGFKPGEKVLSNSPGLAFAQALDACGCEELAYYDPLVAQEAVPWMTKLDTVNWNTSYIKSHFDAVAICVQQRGVDFSVIEKLDGVTVYQYGKDVPSSPVSSPTSLKRKGSMINKRALQAFNNRKPKSKNNSLRGKLVTYNGFMPNVPSLEKSGPTVDVVEAGYSS